MMDLSVIIPARQEEFLELTINSVLDNARANTEVIVILDGYWPEPIKDRKNLSLIHLSNPIGQRVAVNLGARMSEAKYVMKLDAHCAVKKGFDVELMKNCEENWTVIPRMYNLHAFDWVCECGKRTYQGPEPSVCDCGKLSVKKEIIFKPRSKRHYTDYWRFDKDLKFQYWQTRKSDKKIDDTMSCIGACFFMHHNRYWELGGMDEGHGGWGQMGTELACKTWLSGGRMVVNKNTWFAHLFRTQTGFKFPYDIKHSDQKKAEEYSRKLWLGNKWSKQKHNLDWLVKKFNPPGWKEEPLQLSVIIPARNEKYLLKTIKDIKKNFTSNYEIIVGLDDYDAELPADVRVFKSKGRVGMRSLINSMAAMASGKYIMKVDAHCSFDKGYDSKLLSMCGHGLTVLGIRYELDVKKWQRKDRTNCDFRYLSNPFVDNLGGLRGLPWHEWKKATKGQKIAESMSLSGSGWMMLKEQFDWFGGLDDKNYGKMYQEGAEIACKTWLSGGRLLINRDTWYAHWNRGKAPYGLSTKERTKSINYSCDFWRGNKWDKQKYSFDWLIDKFKPPGWPTIAHEPMPAKKQGTLCKGINKLRVDDLWKNRLGISVPEKKFRLEVFFKVFLDFLRGDGKGYYHYLVGHTSKEPVYKDEKVKKRTLRKMEGGMRLLKSIKKNGLLAPLEFYQRNGNLILFRGYRRLAILKHLGIKNVAARVHLSEETAKNVSRPFSIQKGTINEIGSKRFAKLGGLSTDKYYVHNYLPIYDNTIGHLRRNKIKLIEFGILRGASLKLWQEAFPKGAIYGVDKNLTTWKEFAKDFKVFVGMQEDEKFITGKIIPNGPFDVVIDDCSHLPERQFELFKLMWPQINHHGFYIIEDCYRSYKPRQEVNFVQTISSWVDSIYQDYEVLSIQLHYNVCIIQKGL